MIKMEIFEPAMCCSTGVCGPSVNPQLLRITTVVNNLKKKGIIIQRYNLNNNPKEFVNNKEINELIKSNGIEILPITVLEGKIVQTKNYPTNEEIAKYLDIKIENVLNNIETKKKFSLGNLNRK